MTALYIISGVLLLLLWLISRYLHIRIEYIGGRLRLVVGILFIKKELSPAAVSAPKQTQKTASAAPKQEKEQKKTVSAGEMISAVTELVKKLLSQLGKSLTVAHFDLRVTVATDDPATTGIAYGAASGAAAVLTKLILGMRRTKRAYIHTLTEPDFIADTPQFFCDIHLKIRLCNLLPMAVAAAGFIIKIRPEKEQTDAKRNASQTDN